MCRLGNVNQTRSGAYSMGQRIPSPEKGSPEPGPGAFDVTDRELDATRRRSRKEISIAERFDDRRGKVQVPKKHTPGPETALPNHLGVGKVIFATTT